MTDSWEQRATIAPADLDVLARLTAARFSDPAQEAERLEWLDELTSASASLSRAVATLNRHAISECRGSHSKWDMTQDSRVFYDALATYASLVRDVAAEYQRLAPTSADASGIVAERRRNLSIL
ncbi:MAG: hypothetical protein ACT4PJ_13140 [Gemmatimonadaceae bacterium]